MAIISIKQNELTKKQVYYTKVTILNIEILLKLSNISLDLNDFSYSSLATILSFGIMILFGRVLVHMGINILFSLHM